jgi:sugar phosphate isomerase/epimerase
MKFALQDKLTGLVGYQEIYQFAKQSGFEGVEITHFGKKLTHEVANSILAASEATGIQTSAVCGGYNHWIGDFDEQHRSSAVNDIISSLEWTAKIGAQGLIAPAAYGMFSKKLPPFTPPRSEDEDRSVLMDSLKKISEYAEKYNVQLLLEPLNRYEDHMLNTVSQSVSIIKEVGSNKVKVLADFFHMSMEEDNITNTIKENFDQIGYYHLADSNRLQPGQGHSDFEEPLTKLQQLGYDGFLSYECGVRGEVGQELPQSLYYLKENYIKRSITRGKNYEN